MSFNTIIGRAAGTAMAALLIGACLTGGDDISEPDVGVVQQASNHCPSTNVITDPTPFNWEQRSENGETFYYGVLEMGEVTFNINGDTLTTRAYRQQGGAFSIPGPTMNMVPGNKYVLAFHNTLPYEVPSTEHNVFKDANISNVHTHGLHISGETPGDDVTRVFEGGFGGDFVYDIPADHMGGTYWYHAHHHGSTFLQVSGGAFGLIVVDDSADGIPANAAAMTERQLVVGYLDVAAAGTGGDTLLSGTLSSGWTVNGNVGGTMCMPANEWQHFRLLLADRNAMEKTVDFPGCDVELMARDGVWRTTAPKNISGGISLTGASRADFAVRCSADASITVNGNAVATIAVGDPGDGNVHPWDGTLGQTWSATRPDYLRDLRNETVGNTESVRMGARTVNGSKFDHMEPTFQLDANAMQEWSVNGAAKHPFHLHIYHVQAQNCGSDFEDGEYYDVVASNCKVRFDLNAQTTSAYEGRTIMHCHILAHEDQGAMGFLQVNAGPGVIGAPTYPSTSYTPYFAIPTNPPVCGDSSCNGSEDQCICAADCGTPPSTETSCTDGIDNDCGGGVDCADSDCSGDPACEVCGNSSCANGEDQCSCAADCGTPPSAETSCTDGIDNDCGGGTDCDDSDCSSDPACQLACDNDGICESGEDCTNCGNDCDGVQNGRPTNRYCCGNGTPESAEGDGSICDGNF